MGAFGRTKRFYAGAMRVSASRLRLLVSGCGLFAEEQGAY
jgi:hypothetical protein